MQVGGRIFNLAYACALREVKILMEHEIDLQCLYEPDAAFWCTAATRGSRCKNVIDATFVDVEAIMLCASVPSTLHRNIRFTLQTLHTVFSKLNMTINWKPGKSELMIAHRGRKALEHKCKLAQSDGSTLFRLPSGLGGQFINVV